VICLLHQKSRDHIDAEGIDCYDCLTSRQLAAAHARAGKIEDAALVKIANLEAEWKRLSTEGAAYTDSLRRRADDKQAAWDHQVLVRADLEKKNEKLREALNVLLHDVMWVLSREVASTDVDLLVAKKHFEEIRTMLLEMDGLA
jgi:hypothetical protein